MGRILLGPFVVQSIQEFGYSESAPTSCLIQAHQFQEHVQVDRAVIFCNGDITSVEAPFAASQKDRLLIAADGGTRHCRCLGIIPDMVIGDGDSLSPSDRLFIEHHRIPFQVHSRDKDATDFELALRFADQKGIVEVTVLGALGGRWDMSLSNLILAAHDSFRHLRIMFRTDRLWATVIHAGVSHCFEGKLGQTLSLIPLGNNLTSVWLNGCKWPLAGASLELGSTRGLSNRITSAKVEVRLDQGKLLLMVAPTS